MISRLTLLAALVATLAAGSMAFAASNAAVTHTEARTRTVRIIELPRVVVTAKRLPAVPN